MHVGKSSSHNEYMAMSHAAVETKWVRDLIKEMGFNQWVTEPTALMGDNDQATRWSVENMVTTGNKCIRTEYHWVKESYEEGDISPQRIETARNLSDCMTKALPREVIDRLVGGLTGYEDMGAILIHISSQCHVLVRPRAARKATACSNRD